MYTDAKMPKWMGKESHRKRKMKMRHEDEKTSFCAVTAKLQASECGPCWAFRVPSEERIFRHHANGCSNVCCDDRDRLVMFSNDPRLLKYLAMKMT